MKKRILSFALALCFVFTLIPAAFADSETPNGVCGDNLTWVLANGVLTISGKGEMDGCDFSAPWHDYTDEITKVVITQGVTSVEARAFADCPNLKTVVLPEGVEDIEGSAFQNCTSLESIIFPNSLKSIGYSAFDSCVSLTNITLPNNLEIIGVAAFYGCDGLKSITIPSSVTMTNEAFGGCTGLETINVTADNSTYSSENGVLFNKSKTALITYPAGKTDAAYVIPSSVIDIERGAFAYSQVKRVTIADSVKSIGANAFGTCANLENVEIPDGVTSIGGGAFQWCSTLKTVTVPNTVSKITYWTFLGCENLKSVTVPSSVETIEAGAFWGNNSLSDVYYKGTSAQWNAVEIVKDTNTALDKATVHFEEHTHSYTTAVTAPTCTEDGYTTHTCACGYSYKDTYTKALGHSYKNGKCTRCGAADPKYIAAPALKITTVSGHPKIYWNSVDGAYKYWVYRSTDGKNFKYYDRTSKTSYTNNATNVGTLYYYKVKAVKAVDGKDVASVYSNTRSIRCKPAAPKLTLTRSAGKPKLSWNSVKGADKYWIYRSTDGKNYKYYDSTTKTTYTNNSTTIAQRYWYKVKAVKVVNGNNYASVYSNSDFVWVSTKAPTLKITTYKGDPKITWNSVSGAKLYWVFVSTDGKTYYFLNETKNTSYIDKNVKAGKKYYYKVQAVALYNGTFAIPSAYSYPVSITAK